MKFFSTIVAVIALATSASAAFSSCGAADDDFTFSGVTYTPNPPKVNQDVCITLTGSLKDDVTAGATIHVSATFWGISVYDQTSDLCDALVGGANPCPILASTTSVTHCITVPSNVPAGVSINLKAVVTNADGGRVFCIGGPMTFSN
ncbi:Phosphatidylglycerol/phosphatidylinositol transfer protein [Mortierella polycephala]|uniref:Phosphatidylglycerol/phosphatidylinositol transfer protein n=1 Tax=Mortierella polycephala TaxID=41804 RepID=A0A9P6PY91_9FUNG|nr:Phosphatidylglycerol/phosphatidylinositol transfer protein [Mortierella polycephala]